MRRFALLIILFALLFLLIAPVLAQDDFPPPLPEPVTDESVPGQLVGLAFAVVATMHFLKWLFAKRLRQTFNWSDETYGTVNRVMSLVLGIGAAFALHVDALVLLGKDGSVLGIIIAGILVSGGNVFLHDNWHNLLSIFETFGSLMNSFQRTPEVTATAVRPDVG